MSNSHADSPAHYLALPASGHKASWTLADSTHLSHVDLLWENEGWTANGVLGSENAHYVIRMSAMWVVQQFLLFRDMDEPDLWLGRDRSGRWGEVNGAHRPDLDGCSDIELRMNPFTPSITMKRLPLLEQHAASITVATVNVETLEVLPRQRTYSRLESNRWRYTSAYHEREVESTLDEYGLIVDEPNAFSRRGLDTPSS